MKTLFIFFFSLFPVIVFASYNGILLDSTNLQPINNALISDSKHSVRSDINGSFILNSKEKTYHVKAYGYRPYSFNEDLNNSHIKLEAIHVKALYLTFWGASNNSKYFINGQKNKSKCSHCRCKK